MSVIVTVKVVGDTEVFYNSLAERPGEYRDLGDRIRSQGGRHHQYAIGDGFGLIVDEWDSPEAFKALFNDPEVQAFMAAAGADPAIPPEITIAEAVDSPDKF